MKHQSMKTLLRRSVLAAGVLALVAGSASAATYNLRAGTTNAIYGTESVQMWGYALVSSDIGAGTVTGDNIVTVPGPVIYVPAGQDLTINLTNDLAQSTSIVVQGQALKGPPAFSGGRVTAFTSEASASGGIVTYTWTAAELKAGTYLYSSGSHPAQQVHMGLYGALVVDADSDGDLTTLEAYPGVFYDRDIVVVYSEVDPALHNDLASKTAKALNYKPKYFLVNGDETGSNVLTDVTPANLNSRVLLRFVNAGLKGYSPTLLGEDLEWIAEDGNTYPHVRRSYGSPLAAGKTMDAIWVPATFDRHALYDRRLHMSANGAAGGGMRAFLDSANDTLPVADAGPDQVHVDMFDGVGGQTIITLTGGPATGVSYEWALLAFPAGSTASLSDVTAAAPTFTLDVPGTYTAQLVVTDGGGVSSAPDVVNVFTNLAPVAIAGADQTVDVNAVVSLDGSASYDPDAVDAIVSYQWMVTDPNGTPFTLSGASASFTASLVGAYSVDLTVSDGELTGTDAMTVTSAVFANEPPTAVNDFYQVVWKTAGNVLNVLVNDSDADGTLVPTTLAIVTQPMNGAIAEPSNGVILYTPKNGFKGTDFFTYQICDDQGACSEAQVLVNVVK